MPKVGLLVNLELERKLLALAASHAEAALAVNKSGGEALFNGRQHKLIYAAVESLLLASRPIERTLVRDTLDSRRGRNAHYFEGLFRDAEQVSLADTSSYIGILADYAERRRLAGLGGGFFSSVFDLARDIRAEKALFTQTLGDTKACFSPQSSTSLFDDFPAIGAQIESQQMADKRIVFPWKGLASIVGPLKPGDFNIIAARPSMGKTTFALNVAMHLAALGPVLFFSLEMGKEQLGVKLMSAYYGKPQETFETPQAIAWMKSPRGKVESVIKNLYIYDNFNGSIDTVRGVVFDFLATGKQPVLIVVDYIQLMGHGSIRSAKDESREREISLVSRGLKILAKEARCPILALSQLNRRVEERANKTPVLSDLRDSGSLEQDADLVGMLFREDYYRRDAVPGLTDVMILKNRMGPTGNAQLLLEAELSRFMEGR